MNMKTQVSVEKLTTKDVLLLVLKGSASVPVVLPRLEAKALGEQLLLAARLRAPRRSRSASRK
jgi:hypothetical protein